MDESLSKVKRLSNTLAQDGRSLKEVLAYKGISLWWFVEHSIYMSLKDESRKKSALNRFAPITTFIITAFFILRLALRFLVGRCLSGRKSRGTPKIIFCSSLWHWGEIWGLDPPHVKFGDAILGNVIDEVSKRGFDAVCIDRDDSHKINLGKLYKKLSKSRGGWKTIESYASAGMIMESLIWRSKMESAWKKFLEEACENASAEERDTIRKIYRDSRVFFSYHALQALVYINLADRMLSAEDPKALFVAGEHADSGRAIVAVGRTRGIPTMVIQHGFFAYKNVMYLNDPQEVSDEPSPNANPIADMFAVYGPWAKEVLKKFNYPEKRMVITGQPRYDILADAKSVFKKENFYRKFGIGKSAKVVLIATQPFSQRGDSEIFLRNTLKSLRRLKDSKEIEVIIKPHPVENEGWHRSIAEDECVDAKILPKESSIYEALNACDAMVTVHSTTIIEAMILLKPILTVRLTKAAYETPYAKKGAVIDVRKREDIAPALRKVLYDKATIERLKKAEKTYVYQHAYRQDGHATERVADVLLRLAKGQ